MIASRRAPFHEGTCAVLRTCVDSPQGGDWVIDPRRKLGYALRDASLRYTRLFEQRARALGLTLMQCRALVLLSENDGITQRELAKLIEVDAMGIVRIVDRMEALGWVRRLKTPDDRRTRRLQVTPAADPILSRIRAIVVEVRGLALSGFSEAECALFMSFLERLHGNLADESPPPTT
jgi:DNA-binding MarR family transcriptional regulator